MYSLLRLICCEFVHPTELGPTVLAHDIAHHVAASEHHPFLYCTEGQVDDTLEEISTSCKEITGTGCKWYIILHLLNSPVAPVKRVLINWLRLVRFVWHSAQLNSFKPPRCSKKMRPIFITLLFVCSSSPPILNALRLTHTIRVCARMCQYVCVCLWWDLRECNVSLFAQSGYSQNRNMYFVTVLLLF